MHFTPTIVAAVGILASTASAGRISLYSFSTGCTGNSYNCNVGPGFCCVDATQRYTGAVLSQAPGKTLGYFVPDPGGNRCGNRKGTNPAGACGSLGGHRGGITGAKILRNGRRSVEEREEEGECVVPDSVTLGDGTTLKVNYDVPTLNNSLIKHLVDAGVESKEEFPEDLHKYITNSSEAE